jgi:hypothetical protein
LRKSFDKVNSILISLPAVTNEGAIGNRPKRICFRKRHAAKTSEANEHIKPKEWRKLANNRLNASDHMTLNNLDIYPKIGNKVLPIAMRYGQSTLE